MGYNGGLNIFLFPYALIFCYIVIWSCAFPIYSSLKKRGVRIGLGRCIVFGVILSWILPILFSVLAGKFQSWFTTSSSSIFYDLFYGGLFGASIGAIFFGLHTRPAFFFEKIILGAMCLFAIVGHVLVPIILGIMWNLFLKPSPPPFDQVSENTYNPSDYGAERAYESVSANSLHGVELKKALKKILPEGLSRDRVEHILSLSRDEGTVTLTMRKNDRYETEYIQWAGQLTPLKNGCKYFNWLVAVQYDAHQTLKSFKLSSVDGCGKIVEF